MSMKTMVKRALGMAGYDIRRKGGGPNLYRHLPRWEYQKAIIEPHLAPDALVIDVGSGHHPCPQASILVEAFPDGSVHRHAPVVEDRPLVVCSVGRLPFLSNVFDFVYCSHVLEHVPSPVRAAAELARIGRMGFIETPAYGKDLLVGTGGMHRWQVVEFRGELHFFEYSSRQKEACASSPFMDAWNAEQSHVWQEFFWNRQDVLNAMLVWRTPPSIIEHRREGASEPRVTEWRQINEDSLPPAPGTLTVGEIALLERCLATPDGRAPMRVSGNRFTDASGRIIYPVRGKRIYVELEES